METRIPTRLSRAEGRRFGLTVGAVFLAVAGISVWRGHPVAPIVLAAVGGGLFLAGLVLPGWLGPAYRGWMGLAKILSKITTPVFMGVIYFLVLSPMGLIRRLLGHNSLTRPSGETFWVTRPADKRRSDLQRQY